ncbi:MAG: DUF6345 domain-containing protein [Ruminiclostridium sp.]
MCRKIFLKKKLTLFLSLALVLTTFSSTTNVYAANLIKVGASVESKYSSVGNCSHGDRVTDLYADRFISEITYDPIFSDPVAEKLFKWQDADAWELDMLHSGIYGISYDNVDDVDFMVFAGHGFYNNHGVPYNSMHYFTMNSSTDFHPDNGDQGHAEDIANADSQEVWWGYDVYDVNPITKWVTTYSCNFLNTSGNGWNSIMQGVHLVMGFGSVMYIVADEGKTYGKKLREGTEIKTAFFDTAKQYQPQNSTPTIVRVLGAGISEHDTLTNYSEKPKPIGDANESYYYWTTTVQPN